MRVAVEHLPLLSRGTTPATPTKIVVEHVPEILPPAETTEAPGAEAAEAFPLEVGEELVLSEKDWSDLYGLPSEAVALAVGAPEIKFSEATCRTQGLRLARFCQRHGIALPPWLDVVPIASRAVGDYGKLFRDASVLVKERRETKKLPDKELQEGQEIPGEIIIPESSVEHRAEVPLGIDDRIQKALGERR
jgi:hypothetical protein